MTDVAGGTIQRDMSDTCGLGRRGLEPFCSSTVALENPGLWRRRAPTAGFRDGGRVSATASDSETSAGRAADCVRRGVLSVLLLLPAICTLLAATFVLPVGTNRSPGPSRVGTSFDGALLLLIGLALASLEVGCRTIRSSSAFDCTIFAMPVNVWGRQLGTSRHSVSCVAGSNTRHL